MNERIWEGKNREDADKLITNLLNVCDGEGAFRDYYGFTLWTKALRALAKRRAPVIYCLQIIAAMKKAGLKSVEEFESTAQTFNESDPFKGQTPQRFVFFIPIRLKPADDVDVSPTIQILGRKLQFVKRQAVEQELDNQDLSDVLFQKLLIRPNSIPEFFIRAEGEGKDWGVAWDSVESAFDTFRGILELTHSFGKITISSGAQPRNKFGCPEWLLSVAAGSRIEGALFNTDTNDDSRQPGRVTAKEHTVFLENCAPFSDVPGDKSVILVLANSLCLYVQAMDVTLGHRRLLSYWQMAEALVLSDRFGGDTKQVCSRLAVFPQRSPRYSQGLKEALIEISEKRNDIVHRGRQTNATDDDVIILKTACEAALSWIWNHKTALPTENHLECYFSHLSKHDPGLQVIQDTIAFIVESRAPA